MSRDRDYEDRQRWARQDRERAARLAEWLKDRKDNGVPTKPPLLQSRLKWIKFPFGGATGSDATGQLDVDGAMDVHFNADFPRTETGMVGEPQAISRLDVRMRLNGDPRHSWHDMTRAALTEDEHSHIGRLIVVAYNEQRAPQPASLSASGKRRPWEPGPTERPGSPHLDPRNDEYWSREATQERAEEKALLREGRERYGDDWYPGKYVN